MSPKVFNCPHCGKFLPEDVWKKESNVNKAGVKCPYCGSLRVWKDAKRYTPSGVMQRYSCKDCGYRFSKW